MIPTPQPEPAAAPPPVQIRPMDLADIPAIVSLVNSADAVDCADEGTSEAELRAWVAGSAGAPNHFVATAPDGRIVGYSDVHHRPGDDGGWGWIVVLPAWRRQGLGARLGAQVEARARELGLLWLDFAVDARLAAARAWLDTLGLEPLRTYLRLSLDTGRPLLAPHWPPGFGVRTFRAGGDEAAVHRILHAHFADHHNVNEIPMEQLEQNLQQPWFDPRGLFLAESPSGEVVGLCWCAINPDENARRWAAIGWINDLGVARAYRRQGLGRALLLTGIAWLRAEGMASVELWVDGGNREARALYDALGFTVAKTLTDYRHYLYTPRRPAPAPPPA